MNRPILFLFAIAALVPVVNGANAVGGGGESSGGDCTGYYHQAVVQVLPVIGGGDIEVWSAIPNCNNAHSNTQVFQWAGRMTGPIVLGVATATWTITGVSGCTVGTITTLNDMGAAATGVSATATITMTSNECHFITTFTMSIAAAFQTRPQFAHNINTQGPSTVFECGSPEVSVNSITPTSTCDTPQVNNFNIMCAATGATIESFTEAQVCNTPTYTATVTNAGTLALTGSINVANSGTIHTIIDTWPNLVAAVTNSGTINVVNSGGQAMAVTGSLTVSGGLTVTNAGGQSITITSWPQLQAVLSGTINVVNSGTQHLIVDSLPTVNIAGSLTTTIAAWPNLSVGITSFPALNISSVPTLTVNDQVHILDWPTLRAIANGTFTINGLTINQTVGAMNFTFPMSLMVQLCGPGLLINGTCSNPVLNVHGDANATLQPVNFKGGLFIMITVLAFAFAFLGEWNGGSIWLIFSGAMFWAAARVAWLTSAELGFLGKTFGMLRVLITMLILAGLYVWSRVGNEARHEIKNRRNTE